MVILKKNILNNFLNFKIIDLNLIILLLFIHLIVFYLLKNNNLMILLSIYLNNFIKNSINLNSRNIIFFFSLVLFNIILFSNFIDLFPNNLIKNFLNLKQIEIVPTSNINITFCFSIISFLIIIMLTHKKIGFKKYIYSFFIYPINTEYLYLFNFIIESISYIMKPISLSLRLFGNIFSSEIIFNIINNMNVFINSFLNLIWGIFHFIILPLQSFIFITLVIIYVSQTLNH
ncbi:F0F1-type ATP synthase A subunit [Candidatus Carsonella ruddii PV]|uniref:ATP synthase subunit a n=2 Tax=Carsonella ruddii TaxID=114186 RepID=Q9AHX6_CARRU|nr:F0F1 ATP synthase subunit A [Candidatus Carsonella ruddii]AAK17105.1 ATP synthase subunit a [Candidatus Carsonella ruddii]BAF35034.1 F0F1-type ATP synthase A subunit [Candidatus Carsonella ruddii PV]